MPISVAAISDNVRDVTRVYVSVVIFIAPIPVTPDRLGYTCAWLVSWLASQCTLLPSQGEPQWRLNKALSAYSRGGGCGMRSPFRIDPSTFPFDPLTLERRAGNRALSLCAFACESVKLETDAYSRCRGFCRQIRCLRRKFDWTKKAEFTQYLVDNPAKHGTCRGEGVDSDRSLGRWFCTLRNHIGKNRCALANFD
jgi:hypothetical protein